MIKLAWKLKNKRILRIQLIEMRYRKDVDDEEKKNNHRTMKSKQYETWEKKILEKLLVRIWTTCLVAQK